MKCPSKNKTCVEDIVLQGAVSQVTWSTDGGLAASTTIITPFDRRNFSRNPETFKELLDSSKDLQVVIKKYKRWRCWRKKSGMCCKAYLIR